MIANAQYLQFWIDTANINGYNLLKCFISGFPLIPYFPKGKLCSELINGEESNSYKYCRMTEVRAINKMVSISVLLHKEVVPMTAYM